MVQCPSCGGGLRFDIATQRMQCDYCGSQYDPAQIGDSVRDDAKSAKTYEGYIYICPSCGGELMTTDKNDAVGFCPYCGGASMIFDKTHKEWIPESVIPFKITKEQCKEAYIREVRKHIFVSKKYRDPQLIDSFRGIYMPYWTYVAEQKGGYVLEAKSHEKRVSFNTYETDIFEVTGQMDLTVEGYTHDASAAFDDSLSESIAPFDEQARTPFAPGYLSGFYAEIADVKQNEFRHLAREELKQYSINALNNDPNITQELRRRKLRLDPSETNVPINIKSHKRVLRPVWFMSYRNNDKITYAVVNGQTGKVSADLPLSPARILIAALLFAGIIFGILMVGMSNLPSIKGAPTLGIGIGLMLMGLFYTRKSLCCSMESYLLYPDLKPARFLQPSEIIPFLCMVAGMTMIAIDGSYSGAHRAFGMMLALISFFILTVKYINLHNLFKKTKDRIKKSPDMFRMGTAAEAMKLIHDERWLRIVCYVSVLIAVMLAVSDRAPNWAMYAFGFVLMFELFGIVLYTIRFQRDVAKRMPPQFNKKGALYDEQ